MDIKLYKQTTCESCLSCCLLMLSGNLINRKNEIDLFIEGIKRYPFSYSLGICEEFSIKYNKNIIIYVDNKYYSKYLNNLKITDGINIVHQYIDIRFINKKFVPFIIYIDNNVLGEYTHSPHFVIVETINKNNCTIIDPWKGKRLNINKKIIFDGVLLLKRHLKYSPLIIQLI